MLEEIKMIHEQANDLYSKDRNEEAYELVKKLFLEEHTDWLIAQVDKVERYERALELIDKNATSGHVRNIVKKALAENF